MTGEDGLAARVGHAALRPARAAARSGRHALVDEVERAIDAVLAGPILESVTRSVVEHRVVERVLKTALESIPSRPPGPGLEVEELEQAVERLLQSEAVQRLAGDAVDSRLATSLVDQVVASEA